MGLGFIPGQILGVILFSFLGIGGVLRDTYWSLIFGIACLVVSVLILIGWLSDYLKHRKLLKVTNYRSKE